MILNMLHKNSEDGNNDSNDDKKQIAVQYSQLAEKLEQIRSKFDYATDDDDIDALIYEENAILSRMASLYKRAKAMGVSVQFYEIGT